MHIGMNGCQEIFFLKFPFLEEIGLPNEDPDILTVRDVVGGCFVVLLAIPASKERCQELFLEIIPQFLAKISPEFLTEVSAARF